MDNNKSPFSSSGKRRKTSSKTVRQQKKAMKKYSKAAKGNGCKAGKR